MSPAQTHIGDSTAAQVAANEAKLHDLATRYETVANVQHAALFLSPIVANLLLAARRPVLGDLTSTQACVALLSRKPQLHDALKAAHAINDYRAVAESPFIPSFVSADSRSYLDNLRAQLETVVDDDQLLDPWDPEHLDPCLNWDQDTLVHLRSLNLVRPRSTTDDFSIALYNLGAFKKDSVLNARTTAIFSKQNKFFVNGRGTGKTRLLYEGLCLNWGLYFSYNINHIDLGSTDLPHVAQTLPRSPGFRRPGAGSVQASGQMERNSAIASHLFGTLLLGRLLIFQLFLEVAAASPSGITEDHQQRWLLVQLNPRVLLDGYRDPFFEFANLLAQHDGLHLLDNITRVHQKIQTLLKANEHLFIVLDAAQSTAVALKGCFPDATPLLPEIMRVWSRQLTDGCSYIFAGTNVPRDLFDDPRKIGGDYIWCSGTGFFDDPATQEEYVTKLLPPALSTSASGQFLIARIWRWLRGRHDHTAAFLHALINGGLETPHTRLNDYITERTGFEPQDAIDEVAKEVAAAGLKSDRLWRDNFRVIDFSEISFATKSIFMEILFRYMATQRDSPPLGPEHIDLVNSDYALFSDSELSAVSITEPLVLVAAAQKLLPHPDTLFTLHEHTTYHPNNRPATFLGSMRLNAPRTARALSHCLVFYLARVFGEPRPLSDIFKFPHKVPTWADQSGQLVRLHRDSMEVEHSSVSHLDASLPLATETSSAEETAAWLDHRHGTAFCLPSSSTPDILFVLKLADDSFIWVALRAIATDEPIQVDDLKVALSQLEARNLFTGEGDNTLQALPHRSSKLGTHSLLRVVASFPVVIDLERCVNKQSRDVASLNLAALEGTDAEVTQPEFFDSIIAGVLASSKRNAAACY
ncbi:hypothetical protein C8R46DRAFT_62449 [Mycena filopes]|nr:hypothetical protein C8R46DRAFT_62449 [Mycena filopes]